MKAFFFALLIVFLSGCTKINSTDLNLVAIGTIPVSSFPDTIMRGVNWADPSDNFKDGFVIPTGLNSKDNYKSTASKAIPILGAFQAIGANTVRLPINPPSVLSSWWDSYTAVVDEATQRGMKVILCCWESLSYRDGKVDNLEDFWKMWQKVVLKYGNNKDVYFEVINEPFSYSFSELTDLYQQWLSNYAAVPRKRVLLDGTGYAQIVNGIGSDVRFNGCLLSYHNYTWFNGSLTVADWEGEILAINYPERTVVSEFGIPMSSNKNYLNTSTNDRDEAYLQGITNILREKKIASVHWPGLRSGDFYSLLTLSPLGLSINNTSGLKRLQHGWGIDSISGPGTFFDSTALYKVVNRKSNKPLQWNKANSRNDLQIIQWDYLPDSKQNWQLLSRGNGYFSIINLDNGKCLDVINASNSASISLQDQKNGSESQQWLITDVGFGYFKIINRSTNLTLDVSNASLNNGEKVIPWIFHGGLNQQWKIEKL